MKKMIIFLLFFELIFFTSCSEKHLVKIDIEGEGIVYSDDKIVSSFFIEEDEKVLLKAEESEHYSFKGYYINDKKVTSSKEYLVSNIKEDTIIKALFTINEIKEEKQKIVDLLNMNQKEVQVNGIIKAVSNDYSILEDETGLILIENDDNDFQIGDEITIKGIVEITNDSFYIKNLKQVIYNNENIVNFEMDEFSKEEFKKFKTSESYYKKENLNLDFDVNENYFFIDDEKIEVFNYSDEIKEKIQNISNKEFCGYFVRKSKLMFMIVDVVDYETAFIDTITLYTINDLHGVIDEDYTSSGMAKISTFLKTKKDDLTCIISAGDMFQGTALSSSTRGKVMVDIMNEIGFDAMTIGNHEFDWGSENIVKFMDGKEENGEADFPFLCCNIIDNTTLELASFCTPYTTFQKGNYKIGVIGVIGRNQKSDILASLVKNYTFKEELPQIKKYTEILRKEEKCDIVVVSCHFDSEDINSDLASLDGIFKVDAIINGHTHQSYTSENNLPGRAPLQVIQTGSYGKYLGEIKIYIDSKTKKVVDSSSQLIDTKTISLNGDQKIKDILTNYNEYIEKANEELGQNLNTFYQQEGGLYICNVMKEYTSSDIAIMNSGGVRGLGFPIFEGSMITYGSVFEMLPFENVIVTVELKGSTLSKIMDRSGLFFSTNVDQESKTVDGKKLDLNKYYKVVTNDFLFEKENYPFDEGINSNRINEILRDIIAIEIKNNANKNGVFDITK